MDTECALTVHSWSKIAKTKYFLSINGVWVMMGDAVAADEAWSGGVGSSGCI
jgi:hypothetical protein